MTLEIEKLAADLEKMALATARRQQQLQEQVEIYRQALRRFAANWVAIRQALAQAKEQADPKHYRSARPLHEETPLDTAVDAPPTSPQATIVAVDGSQIMPDRHGAYLYYLINVGGIVYHHGSARPPQPFTLPHIVYPGDDASPDEFPPSSGEVNVRRDLEEIGTLARVTTMHQQEQRPLLALLDQRLLYWPTGAGGAADQRSGAAFEWCREMSSIHRAGALLAGYIDRPETAAVITLLRSLLATDDPGFDWKSLGKRSASNGLVDRDLFRTLLEPEQRSQLFVYESPPNRQFAEVDPANEVCFFYLNPGVSGQQIARVDAPRWVAEDSESVTAVHALVVDQCRLLGNYPYVLARADEMAVVGRRDAEELDLMIDLMMQRHGVESAVTAKQSSKELARGGRRPHQGFDGHR